MTKIARHWPVLVTVLVGLPVTLIGLDVGGMWRDEVATQLFLQRSWPSFWRVLANVDAVHGLYYLLMRGWTSFAGISPYSMRLASALAVLATAGLIAHIGQKLGSRWTGLASGLAFLALPRVTYMTNDARSSAFATLALTLFFASFLAAIERGGWRWPLTGLLALVSFAFFSYAALVVAAVGIILLLGYREQARPMILTGLGTALAGVPFLLLMASQHDQISWINPVSADQFLSAAIDIYLPSSRWYSKIIFWTLILLGIWTTIRTPRHRPQRVAALSWGLVVPCWF